MISMVFALMVNQFIGQILLIMILYVSIGRRVMDSNLVKALAVLHNENKVLMAFMLRFACYPRDYDKTWEKMEKEWDSNFLEDIGEIK